MTALLIYPMLCATLFYLGSRALITRWLWSRYPTGFASFMDCPACAGTWYGVFCASAGGLAFDLDFATLAGDDPLTWVVVALCATWWTPVMAAIMDKALEQVGTTVPTE